MTEEATQQGEIKCSTGCEPDMNPQIYLKKKKKKLRKAYYNILLCGGKERPCAENILGACTKWQICGLKEGGHRSRHIEVMLVLLFPPWRRYADAAGVVISVCERNSEAFMQMWSKMAEVN